MKRALSVFLALCMVLTMLPVSAMAEEVHTPIDTCGEITGFAPLTETEKTVANGIALEDLALPEKLTATVRTAVFTGEDSVENTVMDTAEDSAKNAGTDAVESTVVDSVEDAGADAVESTVVDSVEDAGADAVENSVVDYTADAAEDSAEGSIPDSSSPETATPTTTSEPEWEENTVDIKVTWESTPEYAPDTEGVYVFTPVIEGYTVSAELPKITVTVDKSVFAKMQLFAIGDVASIGETGYSTLQAAFDDVADGETIKLLDDIDLSATVTVASGSTKNFILDLNGKALNGGTHIAIQHNGGTLTIQDSEGEGKVTSGAGDGTIYLDGGSLVISGTVENTNTTSVCAAVSNVNSGSVLVDGGTVTGSGSKCYGIANHSTYGNGSVSILDGTVSAGFRAIVNNMQGKVSILGGKVKYTGSTSSDAIANVGTGEVTISGGEVDGGYGYGIYNASTGKIIIPSGSPIIKGQICAMNTAPDLSKYANIEIMASTDYSGSPTVAYDAGGISTYRYLKFESETGISEQFDLALGGTYYFDLSGEAANIGTVNTALPDTTLHYVPFTYVGTVNAYSLTSAMATTESYANTNKSDRSLFVGDYVIGISAIWIKLNTNALIFGKEFDTNYKLRSLSVGSSKTGSAADDSDYVGQPQINEWDQILKKSNSTDNATGWIKNWSGLSSWGQDTYTARSSDRAYRGAVSARYWGTTLAGFGSIYMGFRPVLEVLNPEALGSDGLRPVTLNLNGGKLKESTADIQIVCAGDEFTAPSGEGLTVPADKKFAGWKDTSSTTTYAAGSAVPKTVTGLTAQWADVAVVRNTTTGTDYTTLQAAVDAIKNGETIQLLADIYLTTTVTTPSGSNTHFTLDLNSKTLDSGNQSAILHNGMGILTITDSSVGGTGKITSQITYYNSYADSSVVRLTNRGTLNVTGGMVESTGNSGCAIYPGDYGTVNVSGGTVQATTGNCRAIDGTWQGTVNISGGTVQVTGNDGVAIFGYVGKVTISGSAVVTSSVSTGNAGTVFLSGSGNGNVDVIGGTVKNTAENGVAIRSYSKRSTSINISGGTVSATDGTAIYNHEIGKITISGNGVVTSGNSKLSGGTIYLGGGTEDNTILEITGGTVQNTSTSTDAKVVYNNANGDVKISSGIVDSTGGTGIFVGDGKTGTIVVPSGAPIIKGGTMAMNQAPDLSGYANVVVTASTDYNGSSTVDYDGGNINGYRYLTFSAKTIPVVSNFNLTDKLTAPVTGGTPVTSITDDQYTGTVTWNGNPTVFLSSTVYAATINLTAREGYTFSGVGANAFSHESATGVTNAAGSGDMLTVTVIFPATAAKTPQVLSYVTATVAKTYGDPRFDNQLTQTTVKGTITYTSDNTSVATVDAGTGEVTIVGSGSATITAAAAETSTHAPAVAHYTVTVVPKALILKANDKSMSQGDWLPTFTYTATGLVNGDTVTTAPTMSVATDGASAGTFDIIISGGTVRNAASYVITYANGTLTVTKRLFTVTVTGGTGSGSYAQGTSVTITANDRSGYTFTGWSGMDVIFADAAAKTTTFTMPAKAVAVTANYRENSTDNPGTDNPGTDGNGDSGNGNSGSGDSGSGGGSSSNNNSGLSVTPPVPGKPNYPTRGETRVLGTKDDKGNITVNITDQIVNDAFDKALAEAKKNGTEQNGIAVVLSVSAGSNTASHITVNLPKTVQDTIIAKQIVNTIVVVDNPNIRISLDLPAIRAINTKAKSDVNITATRKDNQTLTGNAKKAIGSRPVFDLKVKYGKGKQVKNFGTGRVSVAIPYTLGANEKAANVLAVYVDAKGQVHWLTNSVYDSVKKMLYFSTDHFSTYGIGYKKVNTAFVDVSDHSNREDIEFVVSRGLIDGTSSTSFDPNASMTRGMFVTALGRLANVDVSSYTKSSFTDVKNDAYYMGYIEWASKNSIANGVGNNKFSPEQSITREQMAVILQNYATAIGFAVPKVHAENIFADNAKISAGAKDAVKQMQMAGIISSKSGNLFNPQGVVTKAEASVALTRLVKLVCSGDAPRN